MYKVTQNGIEYDGCIELTSEDLQEIKQIFEESSLPLNGEKNDGRWTQQTSFVYDGGGNSG